MEFNICSSDLRPCSEQLTAGGVVITRDPIVVSDSLLTFTGDCRDDPLARNAQHYRRRDMVAHYKVPAIPREKTSPTT